MIEVERQFRPTTEQLKALLDGAKFLREELNHDVGYDYPDYRLFKNHVKFCKRNNSFRVKIKILGGAEEEIEDKQGIEKYFGISDVEKFVKENLVVIVDFKNKRRKYKKGDFNIDIDETSFGYNVVEIEVMVEKEEQIKDAEEKIVGLAKKYNFDLKKVVTKRSEYLRLMKPEVYKELYRGKDESEIY